jgi:drug/metabolite transporter (DMT)-like permease
LAGDGLLMGAGLCWATYTVLLRRWHYKPMDATIAVTLLAAIIYLPFYVAFLPKNLAASPLSELVAYGVFQGILVAIIQMIFYTRAVYFLGATRFSMLASIVPVVASLGAVPILGEPLTVFIIIGLFFTCAGAWVGNRVKRS